MSATWRRPCRCSGPKGSISRPTSTTAPCVSPTSSSGWRVSDGPKRRARWQKCPTISTPAAVTRSIGRAHVCTPDTHAQLVCRLLLEQQTKPTQSDEANTYIQTLMQNTYTSYYF